MPCLFSIFTIKILKINVFALLCLLIRITNKIIHYNLRKYI